MSTLQGATPAHDVPTAPARRASLKERMLRAGGWTMGSHVANQVLRLGSNLIMTRLLVPEVFGIMAIVTMLYVVLSLLSDIGLRQAIMQSPRGDSPEFLNSAWTLQVLRGLIIWMLCLLVAAGLMVAGSWDLLPHGTVYAASDLPAVLAATTFSAVIFGLQSTRVHTALRGLDFKRVNVIEMLSQAVGIAVAVVLGWLTRSIWSFVVMSLVSAVISTVLSHTWLPGERNRFQWDHSAVRELLGYGRWVLMSSVVFVLATNADRLLLGGWVDAGVLGLYSIAFNLVAMVEQSGGRLFGSVAVAGLSEVARTEPQKFRALYLKMRLPFDAVFIGAAGVLYAVGPSLVDLMYDDRYAGAGHMLQVLSFGLVFARFGLAGSAYMALGEPQKMAWLNAARLVSIFVLMPLMYFAFGFVGALYAIAFHMVPTLPLMYWYNRKWRLDSLKVEVLAWGAWPAGYAVGLALAWLIGH